MTEKPTRLMEEVRSKHHQSKLDKTELRSLVSNSVAEFAELRRDQLKRDFIKENPDASTQDIVDHLDTHQPMYNQYDPVVHLAIISVDHRNDVDTRRKAASDTAPYLRPKLKQVEHLEDPHAIDAANRKSDLASSLIDHLLKSSSSMSSATAGVANIVPAAYSDPDADADEEDDI